MPYLPLPSGVLSIALRASPTLVAHQRTLIADAHPDLGGALENCFYRVFPHWHHSRGGIQAVFLHEKLDFRLWPPCQAANYFGCLEYTVRRTPDYYWQGILLEKITHLS